MTTGEEIRLIRKDRGITAAELGIALEVPPLFLP